jgi:hypothetical protein
MLLPVCFKSLNGNLWCGMPFVMIITFSLMQEAARLAMPVARLQEEAKAKFNRIQVCVCGL